MNGNVVMTGGSLLINGPTTSANGALDYDSSFKISGGFLVAAGSSGMAQAPGTASSQYSVLLTFKSTISKPAKVKKFSALLQRKVINQLCFHRINLSREVLIRSITVAAQVVPQPTALLWTEHTLPAPN